MLSLLGMQQIGIIHSVLHMSWEYIQSSTGKFKYRGIVGPNSDFVWLNTVLAGTNNNG